MRSVFGSAAMVFGGAALGLACGTSGSGAPGKGAQDSGADTSRSTRNRDSSAPPPPEGGAIPPVDAGSSDGSSSNGDASTACSGSVHSTSAPATGLPQAPAITVPTGFALEVIASVPSARELAALPNGDLLVATNGNSVYLVPNAEGAPGAAVVFATPPETPAQGIVFVPSSCAIYLGSQHSIYAMSYVDGQQTGTIGAAVASVRTGSISPNRPAGDTDNHTSTSVGFAGGTVYAGVGSSCNACVETDPTRASIQALGAGGATTTRATRMRNPIALATNPATGTLWAGGAGQDDLAQGHPYEYFDAVSLHSGVADYGWPVCEEDHVAYGDAGCGSTVVPLIELPAYSTIIGATFYPSKGAGTYAFPAMYRGGLFLTAHGSWHQLDDKYAAALLVAYVPMQGDAPQTPVNWSDPTAQWSMFVGGFQLADGVTRIGKPTGIAVGAQGSLFVADDVNGMVYRIRPM
jgi:glucose/arabinose dehydrogenase